MAVTDGTGAQRDALAYIKAILADYGLPESLADWAWGKIVSGAPTEEVALDLRDTPEFQTRFPAIAAREAAGLSPLSPAEYVAYEQAATQLFRTSGLPAGFYDDKADFTALLAADVSVAELNDRIATDGFRRVVDAPPQVRDAFAEFFGPQGDAALAAFFIDPERAVPVLQRMATQADIAGRALASGGLDLDAARAGELADFGITGLQVQQAAANVAEQAALFRESVSEGTDLTGEREGLNAALGVSDASALRQRQQARVGAFSGGGGAAASNEGVGGLGSGDGGL